MAPVPPAAPRPPAKAQRLDREVTLAPIRDAYKRDLASFFLAQAGAVQGLVGKATKDEGDLIERIVQLLQAKRFRDRLRRISEGPIGTALSLGGQDGAAILGIEASFTLPASEAAIDLLGAHLERLGVGIESTTIADVTRVLERALSEQLTNVETRAALGQLFEGYQDWRLDRISRTELTNAYNLGSLGQYKTAGVMLVRVVDGDLDDPCAAANGATWTVEEAEGNPSSHPNCTRTFIPDTSGF